MTTVYQSPYNLTDEQVSAPDTPTFLLPICTTPDRLAKMLGALIEGGMVLGYGQIDDYNIDFFEALAKLTTCDDTTTPVETPEVVTQVMQGFLAGCSCDDDCEEDMGNLRIELIDGVPYLEEDCGCGVRKYYGLTQASVNPQTGAIAGQLDTPPSYINEVPLTQAQIDSCYADSVAEIITNALVAYTDAVFNYALLGASALFPVSTAAVIGAIEIQQGIVAALNGNLTLDFSNVGYTADEVKAVFQGIAFQTFIKDRLGDDQQVSRWVLDLVSLRLSNNGGLNFPTPTHPVFAAWVRMVNIAELNNLLQIAATECSTGVTVPVLPEVAGATWYADFNFVQQGDQLGWANGSTPESGAEGLFDAATGWYPASTGDFEKAIKTKYSEVLTIVAVRVTLNMPMDGTANEARVVEHSPLTVIYAESHTENPILMEVAEEEYEYLQVEVQRNPSPSDMTAWRIERIEVWGVDTPPTNGNVIVLS